MAIIPYIQIVGKIDYAAYPLLTISNLKGISKTPNHFKIEILPLVVTEIILYPYPQNP